MITLGQVEPYQQQTNYTCSAATLLAVLRHYGVTGLDEPSLTTLIDARPKIGANADKVLNAARALGFRVDIIRFENLVQARWYTDHDYPIIANVESWTQPPNRHYVVITRINDNAVYLMDPNVPGNRRVLTHAAFRSRWTGAQRLGFTGIVVRPQ